MRFYRFTETSYAQIQAVGVSFQIGATIVGIAPERWFQPGGRDRRKPRLFSRLAIHILAADYGNGVRTAFGICLGTVRAEFKTKGMYRDQPTSEPLGWQFWRYRARVA